MDLRDNYAYSYTRWNTTIESKVSGICSQLINFLIIFILNFDISLRNNLYDNDNFNILKMS